MMVIDNKYEIGQVVYLKTDVDQLERIVTGISISIGGLIRYQLSQATFDTWHYEIEISENIDVIKNYSE